MPSIASYMHKINNNLEVDTEFTDDEKAMMSVQMADTICNAIQLGATIASRETYENVETFGSELAEQQVAAKKAKLDKDIEKTREIVLKGLEELDETSNLYGLESLMSYCHQSTVDGLGVQAVQEFASEYLDDVQAGKDVVFDESYANEARFNVDVEMGPSYDGSGFLEGVYDDADYDVDGDPDWEYE